MVDEQALQQRVEELEAAHGYATRLLVSLMEKHYPDRSPQWEPLSDLMGVLTQLDNMSTGLVRAETADEAEASAIKWQDQALRDLGRDLGRAEQAEARERALQQRVEELEQMVATLLKAARSNAEAAEARERVLREALVKVRDRLNAFVGAVGDVTDCSADVDALNEADAALSAPKEGG